MGAPQRTRLITLFNIIRYEAINAWPYYPTLFSS